jgi:DNA-binding NtrC family response regulator
MSEGKSAREQVRKVSGAPKANDSGLADPNHAGHREDVRLRLLALKDQARALLEEVDTVDAAVGPDAGPIDFYEEVRRFEIGLIQWALRRANGVQTEAAALLGLKPPTLNAKLQQYGLSAADFARRPASAQ